MHRRFFALFTCFCLLFPTLLFAEWNVVDTRKVPTNHSGLRHVVATLKDTVGSVELHLVLFDRARFSLKVVDLSEGESVAKGLHRAGAVAGTNGGFFHEDRTPLGLMIEDGRKIHGLEHAKILSGIVAVNRKGAVLLRTGEMGASAKYTEALQAGPFLVDHGQAVPGLNASKRAERTVVIADKQGVIGLLITEPLTLAEAAEVLDGPEIIPGMKIERALNLDGGSSTALWIASEPVFSHSEWKQVRNALGIVPGR